MKLILIDTNPAICAAWQAYFNNEPNVHIVNDDIRNITNLFPVDPIIIATAGNSFGVMGGGIDYIIANYIPSIEAYVKKKIWFQWNGELNVGSAIVVDHNECNKLRRKDINGIIYAPTMMAPIKINGTPNVYLAMKAILQKFTEYCNNVSFYDKEVALVVPGLGGGCGQVTPNAVAKQMVLAYRNHVSKNNETTTLGMRKAYNEVWHAYQN